MRLYYETGLTQSITHHFKQAGHFKMHVKCQRLITTNASSVSFTVIQGWWTTTVKILPPQFEKMEHFPEGHTG